MLQEILYGRLVRVIIRTIWIAFLCSSLIYGSVAPNPFLRPGSNRKPPPPVQPVFKPKKIIRPNFAQEVEFKGYFILKGQVYFSVFNKKVNHGEWITINEKTYEDFLAQEFDLESETLTISYEGQSFELKLLESKSGSSLPPSSNRSPVLPKSIPKVSQSSTPKVMPPKPRSNPVIPSFLVNKPIGNRFPGARVGPSSGGGSGSSSQAMLPGLPYPGFVPRRTISANPSSPISNLPSNQTKSPEQSSGSSKTSLSQDSMPNVSTNPWISNRANEDMSSSNGDIDLDSLPPPPPPPNILPPSPPPNLLPARED